MHGTVQYSIVQHSTVITQMSHSTHDGVVECSVVNLVHRKSPPPSTVLSSQSNVVSGDR